MKILLVILILGALLLLARKAKKKSSQPNTVHTSHTSAFSDDPDDELPETLPSLPHPIPLGDKNFSVWQGDMLIEFTYDPHTGEKNKRHKLHLKEIIVRNVYKLWLKGLDEESNKEMEFRLHYVSTKILTKSQRFEDEEFLERLGIDPDLYDNDDGKYDQYVEKERRDQKEKAINTWEASLTTVWEAPVPEEISFKYGNKDHVNFALKAIRIGKNKQHYFFGYDDAAEDDLYLRTDRIQGQIRKGITKTDVKDFIALKTAAA